MTPQPAGWATHEESAVPGSGREGDYPWLSLVEDLSMTPDAVFFRGGDGLIGGTHAAMRTATRADTAGRDDEVRTETTGPVGAFAVWTLGDSDRSPGLARNYTHSALCGWGLEELDDSIAVAVSEMVTNAMCHNRRPDARTEGPTGDPCAERVQPVLLSLARQDRSVLCVVVDAGCSAPEVREPGELAESGRGLHIIECLSDDWGWTVPSPAGKAVWATFSTADSPSRAHCKRARGEALSRVLLLAGILRGTERCPPQPAAVHAPRTR